MTRITVTTPQGNALRADQVAAADNPLQGLTLAQALAWIDANPTDPASTQKVLKNILKSLFTLQREIERKGQI
jgi:hypothetical protein